MLKDHIIIANKMNAYQPLKQFNIWKLTDIRAYLAAILLPLKDQSFISH